jgi:hypothetical protein
MFVDETTIIPVTRILEASGSDVVSWTESDSMEYSLY